MAEFKIDRFKYSWQGDWTAGRNYKRDDIVRVNGKSYVCILTHTSALIFGDDLNAVLPGSNPPQPQPRWKVMTDGRSFLGTWTDTTNYNVGDIVLYQGSLYNCINSHTSLNFANDFSNWLLFAETLNFVGDWTAETTYGVGTVVKYGGNNYKCIVPHTAITNLEFDQDKWEIWYDGTQYRGSWTTETEYRKDDLVKYGGSIFRVITTHTSNDTAFDDSQFSIEFPGNQYDGEWSPAVYYNQGDIVRYGGYLYYATDNNFDTDPSRAADDSTVAWILLAKTYNFQGEWGINEEYKTGDIVLRGGQLFIAVRDVGVNDGDGTTIDYLDPTVWELILPGKIFANSWQFGTQYSVGDVIYYLGSAYVCNFEHISNYSNFPGDNGSGFFYWDTLIQAGQPGGLTTKGDLLTYGLSREVVGDGSTLSDTRLPIGEVNQILSITREQETFWRNFVNDAEVIYVSQTGSDDPGYGTSFNKPFRTVRHAAEYVEDNFDADTPVKISVGPGRFEEIAPIVVKANTAINGDELRTTTIVANSSIDEYQNDVQYVKAWILHLSSFIEPLLQGITITPTPGNTARQYGATSLADAVAANTILQLLNDMVAEIEFRLGDAAQTITLRGSNLLTTDPNLLAARNTILRNVEFVAEEIYYYLTVTFPVKTFTKTRIMEDVRSALRGVALDLEYQDSNYGIYTSARRYSNAVNGSRFEDLFYMRDVTGLRDLTTSGLEGTLNPPGVFDLYQRPTGGACVSLDPGWGPDDERVWIKTRSPYIQGVTNIGTACVGQKIDGSLHNGGNKSMVSNDFTQVLSDGVGAYVTNGGRAELVSVFTYYCQVGYLAEDGGIIRATNGNNSYGKFGSIADGNDPTETPQTVTVMNRNNEAQVASTFSGGLTDNIFLLEYTNAGEQYTSASVDITGAGGQVSTEYSDFRNDAIFEARLVNTRGSGSEGGSNYLIRQGFARETLDSTSTIRLGQADPTQFLTEIEGMRILIIAGQGAGQYAYIDGFDPVLKDVTVRKESDDELGWDHVIPGTPIQTSLDSTAQYRIEPRIEVSHPGFNSTSSSLPSATTFVDVTFSGTTEFFFNVEGTPGTGDLLDAVAANATFNITRSGKTYNVTLVNPGAGYAVGDDIIITGDELGGATPANDLRIEVTSTTEDSTNSIVTFRTSGEGVGGRLVALDTNGQAFYSDDGSTWNSTLINFAGDWKKIISNGTRFFALPANDNKIAFSYTGDAWTTRSLPSTSNWVDAAYGNGRFILIAENSTDAAYSFDGLTWATSTMPTGDDSAGDQWQAIAYGLGKFVAITGSQTRDVATTTNGISWTMQNNALPAIDRNWVSLEYGNNRFVAIATDGTSVYSLDGITWYEGGEALVSGQDFVVNSMKYSQGVFFAVGKLSDTGSSDRCFTSEDGLIWAEQILSSSADWATLTYAGLNTDPKWIVLANNDNSQGLNHVLTGKRAVLRSNVFQGSFENIKIWDPGSGYLTDPTITVTDTQFITEVEIDTRIGSGVLPQPGFINRGIGYRTSSTVATIVGDGYADIIPQENELILKGFATIPGPGVQIRITGILDDLTEEPDDLRLFNGVTVTDLGDDGSGNGTRLVKFQISPRLRNEYNLEHGTSVELRSLYSQCRITGHDFLDIGTGNFEQTNYPELYADGAYFLAAPENEVLEQNGGRVFYTSTDQDGNFRTGELFAVQQSTGIVTISAEFFDLDGLSSLSLGGVRLGGSGTVVNEFSTDPTFAADSNNVVPTQRAIATFLADRLSVGGENLETNSLAAGRVKIGTVDNVIENTADEYIFFGRDVVFDGEDAIGNKTAISGTIIGQMLFLRDYNDTIQ